MKKYLLALCLTVLCLSLIFVGCGNSEPSTSSTPTANQTSTAASSTTSQTAATTSASTTSATTPASTTAAATTTQPTSSVKTGGTLRIIVAENPTGSMGIPADAKGQFFIYSRPCIETLVSYNTQAELVGVLATGWKVADDLSYIDFTLRKGVKFQDGSDFNAQAVKFNLELNMKKAVAGTENWSGVTVIDEYTVRLGLKKYLNTVFMDLAQNAGKMISQANYEKNGEEACHWDKVVGTGPFVWAGYQTDKYFEFKRFDGYWGGKPTLDGIKFLIIPDFVTAELSFQGGDADAIYYVGRWGEVARDMVPKGFVAQGSNMGVRGIMPDSGNSGSTLSNLKLREAVEYAIDREKIAKALGNDYAFSLDQASPPHTNGYIPDYKGRTYDPNKAKALLTEAGYPNGFETTIYAGVHISGNEIPAIQAYLKAVNINAKIESTSIAKWLDQESNGWSNGYYTSGMQCLATEANYGTFLARYFTKDNGRYPCVSRSDELLATMTAGLAEPDVAKQKEYYQKANRLIMQDALIIPLWYDQIVWVMTKQVHGLPCSAWTTALDQSYVNVWLGD